MQPGKSEWYTKLAETMTDEDRRQAYFGSVRDNGESPEFMFTCLVGQQFYVGHRYWKREVYIDNRGYIYDPVTGKRLFQGPLHKNPRLLISFFWWMEHQDPALII
jgi:hypothetical protein